VLSPTLQQFRDDIIDVGDLALQVSVGGRHEPTTLNRKISNAYRATRELASSFGESFWLVQGGFTSLPAPDTSVLPMWWQELPLAAGTAEVYGVDAFVGGQWEKLRRVSWNDRYKWQGLARPFNPGTQVVLWTLPEQPDVTANGEHLRFPNQAAYDVTKLTVLLEILIKDNDRSRAAGLTRAALGDARTSLMQVTQGLARRGPIQIGRSHPVGAYAIISSSTSPNTTTTAAGRLAIMRGWC
jgi:hypothetical protein